MAAEASKAIVSANKLIQDATRSVEFLARLEELYASMHRSPAENQMRYEYLLKELKSLDSRNKKVIQ